eukprot:11167314-Lingulodinium_polyedra.AAC.1
MWWPGCLLPVYPLPALMPPHLRRLHKVGQGSRRRRVFGPVSPRPDGSVCVREPREDCRVCIAILWGFGANDKD